MKISVFAVILLLVVSISCAPLSEEWESWKQMYGKKYTTKNEELKRQLIWLSNKKAIEEHNANKEKFGYTLKMNHFGDLTSIEFSKKYNGFRADMKTMWDSYKSAKAQTDFVPLSEIPQSWDWRAKGYVTPVKDQGQCGSCWAFGTTGSLEGRHFNATGKLVSLSEQQLIDCSKSNHGCNGGLPHVAFMYIRDNGGIDTEESYPYTATDGNECSYSSANIGATCTGYTLVHSNESSLLAACYSIGPITVGIDASKKLMYYSDGIFSDPECKNGLFELDHSVLVVGWGTSDDGRDYWLIKNSWSTDWGNEGYFRLARNENNMCGVATSAVYPNV